jgi:two-component system, OmpR family, phosphate regulon sensor histidine kinase PhoR
VEWVLLVVGLLALAFGAFLAARARVAQRDVAAAVGASGADDTVAAARATRERADRLAADTAAAEADRDAFLDSLQIGVLGVEPGFRIVAANPAAHTLLGREPRTLVGRSVIEAFLDTEVEATARAAIENGSATGEYAPSGPDGPRLVVRARRSPAGDLWLLLEDVSELRRLRQIRAEFIDNLSHELRTPLTTVSLLAETLTREADAAGDAIPPRMRDRILKIEVETGHLVQMVSELLDLSRIESGGGLGEVDMLDLGRVAAESTERLRLFADRQGVTLRVEVADGLPPVRGDAARLGQVVVNLVHNAVKFSPDGGDVTVSVRAARGDGQVIVAIEDHGVGIPRKAQPRIFERFYKVDRARVRGEAGGTGLGLAIARHIVEQHGGRIWVESREGKGSTFSFAIPVVSDLPASSNGTGSGTAPALSRPAR